MKGRLLAWPLLGLLQRSFPGLDVAASGSVPAVGGLEVERVLGEGGMGLVWQARDSEVGRQVALKQLRTEHEDDPALREVVLRLLDEANNIGQSCFPEVKRVTRTGPAPDHKPSILQDYELGRAMEIDVLVRAPAAFARAARSCYLHQNEGNDFEATSSRADSRPVRHFPLPGTPGRARRGRTRCRGPATRDGRAAV